MKHKNELIVAILFLLVLGIEIFIYFAGDNVDDSLNVLDDPKKVIGDYIADGTQYKYSSFGADGKPIYSDVSKPYYLYLEEDETFSLELPDSVLSGTYTYQDDKVSLVDTEGNVITRCSFEDDGLHCDKYATLFSKE